MNSRPQQHSQIWQLHLLRLFLPRTDWQCRNSRISMRIEPHSVRPLRYLWEFQRCRRGSRTSKHANAILNILAAELSIQRLALSAHSNGEQSARVHTTQHISQLMNSTFWPRQLLQISHPYCELYKCLVAKHIENTQITEWLDACACACRRKRQMTASVSMLSIVGVASRSAARNWCLLPRISIFVHSCLFQIRIRCRSAHGNVYNILLSKSKIIEKRTSETTILAAFFYCAYRPTVLRVFD